MIMYFAGGESLADLERMVEAGADSTLLSFYAIMNKSDHFSKNNEKYYSKFKNVFLDSGAFSAATIGVNINVNDYINYLKNNAQYLTIYACLDVIGNAEATSMQQLYMESQGVTPLPVFHLSQNTNYESFDKMCEKYDYIALGGVAKMTRDVIRLTKHFDKIFTIIGKHLKQGRKIKTHGFGVTSQWLLEKYPFYSVDSTSWIAGQQYGNIYYWKNKKLRSIHYSDKEVIKFASFGLVDPIKENYSYKARVEFNIK